MKTRFLIAITLLSLFTACTEEREIKSNDDIINNRNVGNNTTVVNENGKKLFMANCASCHNPIKDMTGPALKGAAARVPSKEWLYKWVNNSAKLIGTGDQYAVNIFNTWNKTAMTSFPNFSHQDIDDITAYVDAQ